MPKHIIGVYPRLVGFKLEKQNTMTITYKDYRIDKVEEPYLKPYGNFMFSKGNAPASFARSIEEAKSIIDEVNSVLNRIDKNKQNAVNQ